MAEAIISLQPALWDGLPELDSTASDWESLAMLYGLAMYLQPKVIVEAGTYKGHFAVVIARLLPECAVWTADPTKPDLPDLPNLHYVQMDFDAMLATHLTPGTVDFAFIDSGPPMTDGDTGVRWRHWTTCKNFLRPGGLMACHDTNTVAQWPPYGPRIAQESLLLHGGRGLALWQSQETLG